MPSERVQRQIDRLLDEAEQGMGQRDWAAVQRGALEALALDPGNADAQTFLAAAERVLGETQPTPAVGEALPAVSSPLPGPSHPASFSSGRYAVKRFLGEGGKKKVYLAHDTRLDRDVAFALIKTEGLDEAARERITREAQAMGRLGDHPNIVTVYDIGTESEQPYLVLPLLPGGDVEGLIEKAENHQLSIEQAIQITDQLTGCMLYEMVTGRPPFVGDDNVAIIGQHLNTPPVSPSWHRPGLPKGLEALILRLLEKDPNKRPASAAEVRQALASIDLVVRPPITETMEAAVDNPLYRRTFVGREAELRQLQSAFDGAMSGQGALAMVVGEPGIGKTALVEQLATYVSLRGGRTLVGHCYEEGSLSLPTSPSSRRCGAMY